MLDVDSRCMGNCILLAGEPIAVSQEPQQQGNKHSADQRE